MTSPALSAEPRDKRDAALDVAVDALKTLLNDAALCVHTAHWDSMGTSGANCPVCCRQREAGAAARKALADIEELLK